MNGLAILIAGGLGIAVVLAVRFIVIPLIDAPEGKHAESSDTGYPSWGQMPPEIAHEKYLPAPLATLPAGTARFADRPPQPDPVRYGANLRYRYDGELSAELEQGLPGVPGQPVAGDDPAAAVEQLSPDTLPPPPVTDVPGSEMWADRNAGRFDSALDGPANGHALSGAPLTGAAGPSTLALPDPLAAPLPAPPAPPPVSPQAPTRRDAQGRAGGCAPAGDRCSSDLAPESRPAARADLTGSLSPRPPEERPGPVSAPPDPVTSPLGAVGQAADAVRAMPVDGYLDALQAATAWQDRDPFSGLLSDDTIARGIPAVK